MCCLHKTYSSNVPDWHFYNLSDFSYQCFLSKMQDSAKSKSLLGVGKSGEQIIENSVEASSLDPFNGNEKNLEELRDYIYDIIRTIKDPEKPASLEDLHVVYEEGVFVKQPEENDWIAIRVEFNPTVPHCSLATLIGLCIRIKLERNITEKFKLDIFIKKGAHSTEEEINKQINDKERIAAAMENPNLRELVEGCIQEVD